MAAEKLQVLRGRVPRPECNWSYLS